MCLLELGPGHPGTVSKMATEGTGESPSLYFSQNPSALTQDLSTNESLYNVPAGIGETVNNK